jgi:dTDP-3-amino-3,4,6-trideoxy-alpha-D-glucose transaminase
MIPLASTSTAHSIRANDFATQWRDIRDDTLHAMDRVGNSGWLLLGDEVRSFERELANWWGVAYAVGVASGTDALEIALRCAGVEPGARVLTTPLSAFATTLAILRVGAQPVWCDVYESGALDLEQVAATLRSDGSIRAVLTVHLYGHPQDPGELERIQDEYGVVVIEDCAQAAGAERDGRSTGLAGLAAGTSLYPTKNIGALGDGGVLLTMDASVAERARCLRNYGQRARYEHFEPGLNSRLDELQAAILRSAMLPRLDRWLHRRREIAARYTEALSDCELRPIVADGGRSAHHLFPVEVSRGETTSVIDGLARAGVEIGRHYPFVCPDQKAVQGVGLVKGPLAVARRLAQREISLPIHPYLHNEEVDGVIEACLQVCAWNA